MISSGDLPSYENAITAVSDEIQKLLKQRSEIDFRLSQLKKIADAFAALMTPPPSEANGYATAVAGLEGMPIEDMSGAGITNAIRQVLRASKVPLRPTDIKTALVSGGFDISGYANPGTVIHNTLTRLEKQGEITAIQSSFGTSYAAVVRRTVPPPPGSDEVEDALNAFKKLHKARERK